jgi:hypothetical protein
MKKYIYYGVASLLGIILVVGVYIATHVPEADDNNVENNAEVEQYTEADYAKLREAVAASMPKVDEGSTGSTTETSEGGTSSLDVSPNGGFERMPDMFAQHHSTLGLVKYATVLSHDTSGGRDWNESVVIIDESGKSEVLIADSTTFIRDYYAKSGEETNQNHFSILSAPVDRDVVLVRTGRMDSDAGSGDIFVLNPVTKEITPVTVTETYRHWWNSPQLSFEGGRIVTIPLLNGETYEWERQHMLYVLDLVKDTATLIHTLKDGETFIKSYEDMAEMPILDVEWIDESTVKVGVFKDVEGRYEANEFLRYETVEVK